MNRRNLMKLMASGTVAAALAKKEAKAQEAAAKAANGMKSPIIKDINVIQCSPQGVRLVIVKVTTDQAGVVRIVDVKGKLLREFR